MREEIRPRKLVVVGEIERHLEHAIVGHEELADRDRFWWVVSLDYAAHYVGKRFLVLSAGYRKLQRAVWVFTAIFEHDVAGCMLLLKVPVLRLNPLEYSIVFGQFRADSGRYEDRR